MNNLWVFFKTIKLISIKSLKLDITHSINKSVAALFLILVTSTFSFAQLSVVGVETRVNSTTANSQQRPETAMDTSGNYVVVWEGFGSDGDDYGIYAQLYTTGGSASGGEIQINTSTGGGQRMPDVAMDDEGNFVVVWMSDSTDGDSYGIYGRMYSNTGTATTSQFRISTITSGNQKYPQVACDASGNFVTTWMDDNGGDFNIYAERRNSSGAALAADFVVNSTTAGYQGKPTIAMDPTGNFVIAWQSADASGNGIYFQRYNSAGVAQGSETIANTTTAENQQEPSAAMDGSGNFLITWSSFAQDTTVSNYGIYGRIFDNTGTATTSEILINTTTSGTQDNSSASATKNAGYVVSWTSFNQDGDRAGVYAQMLLSDGSFYDVETKMNTRTTDYQQIPSVASNRLEEDIIVAWQDGLRSSAATHDGSDYGVYSQLFDATDVTPPNAVCQNITVYLDGAGNATITAADVDGGSTDNVGVASLSVNTSAFTCADLGANTVTLTVADAAGNTDNCNATVTVTDTTSPTAVCQNITVYLDGAGNATITAADVDGGSTDNCGTPTLSIDVSSFTCADLGANNVTLTATDGNSNTSNCVAVVTVADTTSPTVVCQNITVYLDGTGNATITASDVDNGSSDNCGTPTLGIDVSSFTCANIGANNVTLTATDGGSNSSSCVAVVTVVDTNSPTAVCQNITVYLDGAGNATITAADVDGGSTVSCGAATLGIDVSSFTCADIGANNVTLTVTDASLNSSSCVAVVTVADTTSPTVVCQNMTVYLDGAGNATITAADVDGGSSDNCGTPTLGIDVSSFTCADLGANNVTLTATDGGSNSSSCVAVVTVADTSSPTAVCQNITVYLDGAGNATITAADVDGGSSDNCGTPSLSIDVSSFTCANIGANNVTLTATDGGSNTSNCVAVVTVVDTTSPMVTCPGNQIENFNASCQFTLPDYTSLVVGSDNCAGTVTITQSPTPGTVISGNSTITMTADDGNGNTSICTFDVIPNDATAPTAVCQNITVYLDGTGNAAITAADVDGGSTDNCGTPILSLDISAFTCANIGANNVTLYASDGINLDSCTAVVTVMDTISPSIICPADVVVCDNVVNGISPSVNDNCSSTTVTYTLSGATTGSGSNDASGLTFNTGTTTVQYTAQDGSGNISTCSFNVTTGSIDTSVTVVPSGDTLIANASGATYQWIDCSTGSYIPSETNQMFIPTVSGLYAVEVTQSTCVDTSSCYNVVLTDINDLEFDDITIYPNPTKGLIEVGLSDVYDRIELTVFDVIGKQVVSRTFRSTNHLTADITEFSKGVYFVRIVSGEKEVVVKIIKN